MVKDKAWVIVVNPHAGSGSAGRRWSDIEPLMKVCDIDYVIANTDCMYHATEIAFKAASDGYRRFMAVGGDGTIHEILDGIMSFREDCLTKKIPVNLSQFVIGVFSSGSGNDWGKVHGIPSGIPEVISLMQDESFAFQDVVKISLLDSGNENLVLKKSYMVNIAGAGFDACVCERVNNMKKHGEKGKMLYVKSLVRTLFRYRPGRAAVFCDGRLLFDGNMLSVSLGTGKYSGGGMLQTPDAVLDDGLTDVTVIPSLSMMKIVREVPKLFSGEIKKVKELVFGRAAKVFIRSCEDGQGLLVEADGEIIGTAPASFEVMDEKIGVLHNNAVLC